MDAFPPWLRLVIAILATWRVTHLIVAEDGPWDIIVRLRLRAGDTMLGRMMDCFYCASVWVAAPIALAVSREPVPWLLSWLAISGGASLLARETNNPPVDGTATRPNTEGAP